MDCDDTLQIVKDRRATERRAAKKPIAHDERRVRSRRSGEDRRDNPRIEC